MSVQEKTPLITERTKPLCWWQTTLLRLGLTLFTVVLVGIFAVHARTFPAETTGTIPSNSAVGAVHFVTEAASLLWGLQSVAGLNSLGLLLVSWLAIYNFVDKKFYDVLGTTVVVSSIVTYLIVAVGFFVTGLIGAGLFSQGAQQLALDIPAAAGGAYNVLFVLLLEFLAKLFVYIVFLVTTSGMAVNSAVGLWIASLATAAVNGVMIAVLRDITGGSLNATRSLGTALGYLAVEGNDTQVENALEIAGWGFLSEIAAVLVSWVLIKYVFTMKAFALKTQIVSKKN
jgi:hypothetical protein